MWIHWTKETIIAPCWGSWWSMWIHSSLDKENHESAMLVTFIPEVRSMWHTPPDRAYARFSVRLVVSRTVWKGDGLSTPREYSKSDVFVRNHLEYKQASVVEPAYQHEFYVFCIHLGFSGHHGIGIYHHYGIFIQRQPKWQVFWSSWNPRLIHTPR